MFDSGWEVRIRILRKCIYRCTGTIGTHCTFIWMCTVRIVKNNYLHNWESLAMLLFGVFVINEFHFNIEKLDQKVPNKVALSKATMATAKGLSREV